MSELIGQLRDQLLVADQIIIDKGPDYNSDFRYEFVIRNTVDNYEYSEVCLYSLSEKILRQLLEQAEVYVGF